VPTAARQPRGALCFDLSIHMGRMYWPGHVLASSPHRCCRLYLGIAMPPQVIINLPPHIQLLCMSATVRNPEDLGGWISEVLSAASGLGDALRLVPLMRLCRGWELGPALPLPPPILACSAACAMA
jgi:hypothetical protein